MANAFQQRLLRPSSRSCGLRHPPMHGRFGESYSDHRDLSETASYLAISQRAHRYCAMAPYVRASLPPWRIFKGASALLHIAAATCELCPRGNHRRTKTVGPIGASSCHASHVHERGEHRAALVMA